MSQIGALARALAGPFHQPSPGLMPLTWNERRLPFPEQPGLADLEILEARGPGVYIIEKTMATQSDYTVYVGSVRTGTLYSRLRDHGRNWKITQHRGNGLMTGMTGLRAFWALTGLLNPRGVEKYLSNILHPAEGDRHPENVEAVGVVLPQPIFNRMHGIVRPPSGLAALGPY